jgi:hypothetical protein
MARGGGAADDREATLTQIRAGAKSLRALLIATTACDTLLNGPMVAVSPRPPNRRQGEWGNRFIRTTGIVAVSTGLLNLAAGMRDADPEMRERLGYIGGAAGGVGALFSMLRPRPKPAPYVDPVVRARTMFREEQLRVAYAEAAGRLHELAAELGAMEADPAPTDSAAIELIHRYSGVLELTSSIYDTQVPHVAMLALSIGEDPSFSEPARIRLSGLVRHLDRSEAEWRAWRWLVARSQRGALGYLAQVKN